MHPSQLTLKVRGICHHLQELKITPKEFIDELLSSSDEDLAFRQRFWATANGWDSTFLLVKRIKSLFLGTAVGRKRWERFIQEEVSDFPVQLQ